MSAENNSEVTPRRRGGRKPGVVVAKGWRERFLNTLAKNPHVDLACKIARVSRPFVYAERKRSEGFAELWDQAIQAGIALLGTTAWNLATVGERDPIWMKGKNGKPVKVDEVKKINPQVLMFLLRHRDPQYRDSVALTGPNGGPVQHEFTVNLTAEEVGKAFAPKAVLPEGAVDVVAEVQQTNGEKHDETLC